MEKQDSFNFNDIYNDEPKLKLPFETPKIPTIIKYRDDFTEKVHIIKDLHKQEIILISVSGSKSELDFSEFNGEIRNFLLWCISISISYLAAKTVDNYFSSIINHIEEQEIYQLVNTNPHNIKLYWTGLLNKYQLHEIKGLKNILHILCKESLGIWNTDYIALISQLPLPFFDKYSLLRRQSSFLTIEEEQKLISFFDSVAKQLQENNTSISTERLKSIFTILCSYQFGMRPIQIGKVNIQDIRVWQTSDDDISVHITFYKAKQKSIRKALPLTRKVKNEWAIIVNVLYNRRIEEKNQNSSLLELSSAREAAFLIKSSLQKELSIHRSARDLRHAAAQRMVDGGANQEELACFLGHSDLDSCLVYFDISANQAERVNKVLGISNIYSKLARIAHDRFIDKNELLLLKEDQQIAGVPHGIPITGIGGCTTGQLICPYNPITSCYGCYKFMPINNVEIHKQVLMDIRQVVSLFIKSGREDNNSPAFLQLKHTINNIQSIISELEGTSDE